MSIENPEPAKCLQVSCVQLHWGKALEFNLERTLYYIRAAARNGSRVVLFPEASLTGYYFPYLATLSRPAIQETLNETCRAPAENRLWVIVGTIQPTTDRYLNLAHVIDSKGSIVHEYAKVQMAGHDEKKYCRGGNKLSLSE